MCIYLGGRRECSVPGRGRDMMLILRRFWGQFAHTAAHNTTQSHNACPRSSHSRWGLVDEADMAKVKELESVAHALSIDSDCCWSCALCVKWTGRGSAMIREHLASE